MGKLYTARSLVGKLAHTEPHRACGTTRSVYPRVCGGTVYGLSASSHRCAGEPSSEQGSIPACAGEPNTAIRASAGRWVYPRVCGGTPTLPCPDKRYRGLSPRVRGNPNLEAGIPAGEGSIPACAEEPLPPYSVVHWIMVYPRVCGGTGVSTRLPSPDLGLSPRVRGNRAAPDTRVLASGSIPACAGEPPASSLARAGFWVYPRVCGGTERTGQVEPRDIGLSPRVRGNLRDADLHDDRGGSIPACAGEPLERFGAAELAGVYPRVCGGT